MHPLATTKFGPLIARAVQDALTLSEEKIFDKVRDEIPNEYYNGHIPEKNGYCLIFSGDVTELAVFRKHAGEPNGEQYGEPVYHREFDTKADRDAFKARLLTFLKPFVKPDIRFTEAEGPYCDKIPVAIVDLKWNGQVYTVRSEYSYGYPLRVVLFDWEENNYSCDCNRALIIEQQHPGTTGAEVCDGRPCTDGEIPIVGFRLELKEGTHVKLVGPTQ